jgi:hypothetical protein
MNNDKIDVNDLTDRSDLIIFPREDPEQRDSRIRIEEADAAHRRRKDLLLSSSALVVIGVALCLCVWAVVRQDSSASDREWAVPLLTAIVTGLIGYVTGRATK